MSLALKTDNAVKASVRMDDARPVSLKVNLEHSVIDTKTAQEKEKPPAASGLFLISHTGFIAMSGLKLASFECPNAFQFFYATIMPVWY